MSIDALSLPLVLAVSVLIGFSFPKTAKAGGEPPERDTIDDEYKWHPEDLFDNDAAWEAEFTALEAELANVGAYQGRLGESAATLRDAIQATETFAGRAEHLYQYAHINNDQDTRINKYQGMLSRVFNLWMRFEQGVAFMRPEILAIPEDRMAELIVDEALAQYAFYLENINRMRPYTLDADKEAILAATSEMAAGPGEIFDLFTNADLKFPTIKDSEGNDVQVDNTTWYQLRSDEDREVRQAALEAFYGTYFAYRNTLATTYSTHIKADQFNVGMRGYDDSLHSALYPNNIPVAVYTNLVDSVNANLDPLHRYVALKKRVLGLDEFHSHDVYAPLVGKPETEYDYETAVEMVLDAVDPLGKQYVTDLEAGFDAGWVDVHATKGKKSGAYSSTVYDMHPFVLMNYKGELEDVSTLAHEMGHAMHGYYSNETQPYTYHGHTIFVAEVASTTNEVLMIQKLIDEAPSREVKLYLLDFWANQIMNTVYRQTYFAEFELRAHQMAEAGEALTADSLTELYNGIFQKYYGEELILDGHLDMCWARIPHFYRSYYVYQYATSYSASLSLAKGLTTGKKRTRMGRQRDFLGFLAAGDSKYSIDILTDAGVDMTTPQPIEDCLEKFDWIVSEMEKELAK